MASNEPPTDAKWGGNLVHVGQKLSLDSFTIVNLMVKRRNVDDLRPPHPSGLTQRCLFIAALMVGLLCLLVL